MASVGDGTRIRGNRNGQLPVKLHGIRVDPGGSLCKHASALSKGCSSDDNAPLLWAACYPFACA
jgi:hypothetical protein